jgi:hypothetical protein
MISERFEFQVKRFLLPPIPQFFKFDKAAPSKPLKEHFESNFSH